MGSRSASHAAPRQLVPPVIRGFRGAPGPLPDSSVDGAVHLNPMPANLRQRWIKEFPFDGVCQAGAGVRAARRRAPRVHTQPACARYGGTIRDPRARPICLRSKGSRVPRGLWDNSRAQRSMQTMCPRRSRQLRRTAPRRPPAARSAAWAGAAALPARCASSWLPTTARVAICRSNRSGSFARAAAFVPRPPPLALSVLAGWEARTLRRCRRPSRASSSAIEPIWLDRWLGCCPGLCTAPSQCTWCPCPCIWCGSSLAASIPPLCSPRSCVDARALASLPNCSSAGATHRSRAVCLRQSGAPTFERRFGLRRAPVARTCCWWTTWSRRARRWTPAAERSMQPVCFVSLWSLWPPAPHRNPALFLSCLPCPRRCREPPSSCAPCG